MKHTLEYIKRQAKKVKKERGITHTAALEFVSKQLGFDSYKDFLKSFYNLKTEQC